jgi:hypothetical protein
MSRPLRPPAASTVGLVVLASVVLSVFHYTDNYVSIETYPQPDWVTGAVVIVSWIVLTAFGVAGYLLYRNGSIPWAHVCLVVYSYTGLSSIGHFLYGSPDEFTTRGLVSASIDITLGALVLAITVWSILAHRSHPLPSAR